MIPILFVSELKGKLASTSYTSYTPAAFKMVIWFWSRSCSFMFIESANFTRATSSGEEAWYSTIDRS